MARREWEPGLSRPGRVVIALQGLLLAFLLWLTWELLNSDGWFDSPHDHALLWDDAAIATGLVCVVSLLGFALLRRSSGVFAGVVITIVTALALIAMRPA